MSAAAKNDSSSGGGGGGKGGGGGGGGDAGSTNSWVLALTQSIVGPDGVPGDAIRMEGKEWQISCAEAICIGRVNSMEGPQAGGEHIDVEFKEGLVDSETMAKVAEFLKRYAHEPLPFAMRDKLLLKGERQPEKHFFMRPLQSAHFRANIRWGPNGSGLDAAGAAIPDAPKGLAGLWRQPSDPQASLGSDPGVPAATGNYAGPSDAFIQWLDDFIPAPTRSAAEKAADTYPAVLPAGDMGYQKLLFGIMEVASFLQITPLLDLATMRMATIFRKSGGTKGHDAPTEVSFNKDQLRFSDPARGEALGRDEAIAHFGLPDDFTAEEKKEVFNEEKWLVDYKEGGSQA